MMKNYIITQLSVVELRTLITECLSEELAKISDSPAKTESELMNVSQCAKLLNLAIPTIYGLVHRRKIPFIKKQGIKRLYFSRVAILEWLNSKSDPLYLQLN